MAARFCPPHPRDRFDVVVNLQVLAHVPGPGLDIYYREAHRALKPEGVATHQLPHRFMPHAIHPKLWLAHWLPRPVYLSVVKLSGRGSNFARDYLFPRSPGTHRGHLRWLYGTVRDVTFRRLTNSRYGASGGMRAWLARLAANPVPRPLSRAVLPKPIVMETVAVQ